VKELFLFVRPPRPLWPFLSAGMNSWPPLAFASLAAALREALPDLRVAILDAPALEMGWRTLGQELRRLQPAYVGLGEEAVSCVEGLRLARLARDAGARVIAGGCFFGHVATEAVSTGVVDVVVHGEGEVTLVELVQALRHGPPDSLRHVAGLSYHPASFGPTPPRSQPETGQPSDVVFTGHRALIPDLDRLPFPAYDLLPMERYGARSRNHPRFAPLELGRGCRESCSFCVLWRQMGHFQGSRVVPRLRTKSPDRLLEEVRRLVQGHGRGYLGWVDPCFNAHPRVPGELGERMLRENLRPGQSAWVRADALLRDEASGALRTCVEAGLNEVYVGVERPDTAGLEALDKGEDLDQCRRAFRMLAERHPHLFVVGSFLYGVPGDTPDTVRRIYRLSLELELDKAFFIPLTPLPGTPLWRPELWDATGRRFRSFGFLPGTSPGVPQPALDRALLGCFLKDWRPSRWRGYGRGWGSGEARKRRMTWRVFLRSTRFVGGLARRALFGGDASQGLVVPAWYER
jgi:radical SAM superfamily enzyme YgiQ (UPF0313 family)